MVHRQLARARDQLEDATDSEQFQSVGLLCREVMVSLAEAVYDPVRHPPLDGVQPSKSDAKRMLEAFVGVELRGKSNKEARKVATAAIDFANNVQHKRTADHIYAAMCIAATTSVVQIISITARKQDSLSTISQLCMRLVNEGKLGASHEFSMKRIAKSEFGKTIARDLLPNDVMKLAQERLAYVKSATVTQELNQLKRLFEIARDEWNMEVQPEVVEQVSSQLLRDGVIRRSEPRRRLPTEEEYERLIAYFQTQKARTKKVKLPMADICQFARWTGRRIGEICRLRWNDFDEQRKTCVIRGIVDPRRKVKRDHEFPLLPKALEVVVRQPRTGDLIFPYHRASITQSYIAAKRRLGIRDLRMNDFRRETARQMLKAGYSFDEILKVTGRIDVTQLHKELSWHEKHGR